MQFENLIKVNPTPFPTATSWNNKQNKENEPAITWIHKMISLQFQLFCSISAQRSLQCVRNCHLKQLFLLRSLHQTFHGNAIDPTRKIIE